jgi:hypothetical protein
MSNGSNYSKYISLNSVEDGKKSTFLIRFFSPSVELEKIKYTIIQDIDRLVENGWGKFSKDFLLKHIIQSSRLVVVWHEGEIAAVCSASNKKFKAKAVLYLEFTVVKRKFRSFSLSTYLNGEIIAEFYLRSFYHRFGKSIYLVTLTRSPRVIGSLSNFCRKVYPSLKYYKNGRLIPAENETWFIIKAIVESSWKPDRVVDREGAVLHGSYSAMPWLLEPKQEKHYRNDISKFCEQYLKISEKADREFIVVAEYNLLSFLKYKLWNRRKIISLEK